MIFLLLFRAWILSIPAAFILVIFLCVVDLDMSGKTFTQAFKERRKYLLLAVGLPVFGPIYIFKYLKNNLRNDIRSLFNEENNSNSTSD